MCLFNFCICILIVAVLSVRIIRGQLFRSIWSHQPGYSPKADRTAQKIIHLKLDTCADIFSVASICVASIGTTTALMISRIRNRCHLIILTVFQFRNGTRLCCLRMCCTLSVLLHLIAAVNAVYAALFILGLACSLTDVVLQDLLGCVPW